MSRSAPQGRSSPVAVAVAMLAGVLADRVLIGAPAGGLSLFSFVPVILVAVVFGVGLALAQTSRRARRSTEAGERYFELGRDLMCTANLDGTFDRMNGRWEETLGWTDDELRAHPFAVLIHPDDREASRAVFDAVMRGEQSPPGFTNRMRHRDGSWRVFEWASTFDRAHGLIYAAARDVTDREASEGARREAEERFRTAFEHSAAGMAVVALEGETGQILEINEGLAEMLGRSREELLGTAGLAAYAHPEDLPRLRDDLRRLGEGEMRLLRTELRIVRPGGRVLWVEMTSSLLHDEQGRPAYRLSQVIDIDARKRTERQLRDMADHDPLTWLYNRRRFMSDLESELLAHHLRGSRGAVLLIDLDGFKQVNDTAGHAMGDEVLKAVATGLLHRLRSGDVAGRLGGDEFAVLLRRVDAEQAIVVAHSVADAVGETLARLPHPAVRSVSLSVGVALIDSTAPLAADAVLAKADAAMYRAKRAGGDQVALAAEAAPAA